METWQPRILGMRFAVNNGSDYAKNMHVVECTVAKDASQDAIEKASAFVQVSKLAGFVAIVKGDVKYADMLDADGVLLVDLSDIKPAREKLGEDAIIGLSCGADKAKAEAALEQGVDYVTFGNAITAPDIKLLAWWGTLTDKPAAVIGPITSTSTAGHYAMAGATFVDITSYIPTIKKGPVQAVVNMLDAVDMGASPLN